MTPAASASSWTSRAANRTRILSRPSRSSQPRPSRRLRLRGQHRRRRRHPLQMPHAFLKQVAKKDRASTCPAPGEYARGNSLPAAQPDAAPAASKRCSSTSCSPRARRARLAHRADQQLHARRDRQGRRAVHAPGVHRAQPGDRATSMEFERKLYVIRKRAYSEIRTSTHRRRGVLVRREPVATRRSSTRACCSPSSSTQYFPDLQQPAMETALALVHSRFSTNTFPSWDRAHPYRYIAHNGEINTLRGNINWMQRARGAVRVASCSATTSRRSCRSSTRTAATRRCSTTRSSCWCSRAARCRTR